MSDSISISLPGTWWQVPLREADAARKIQQFVVERMGRTDDLAPWRGIARRRLQELIRQADSAVVESMYLGVELSESIPLPALVTVHRPLPVPVANSSQASDVLAGMLLTVQAAEHEPGGGTSDETFATPGDVVIPTTDSKLLKTERLVWDERGELAAVSNRYWVAVPGRMEVVLVHIDAPETPFSGLFAKLFDEIAMSITFTKSSLRDELGL